jgi:hypothetical protein
MQFSGLIVGYVRSGVIIANGPRSGQAMDRLATRYCAELRIVVLKMDVRAVWVCVSSM